MKYILIGLGIGLMMIVGYMVFVYSLRYEEQLKEATYWKAKNFKPDTVYSSKTFSDTKFYPEDVKQDKVPPLTTTIYNTELPKGYVDFTNKVLAYIDSSRKDTTKINPNYLTLYPRNPKFLGGRFRADSISLDLLSIDGDIRTDVYPVDYSLFKYDYYNNSMHASEIKTSNRRNSAKSKFFQYNGSYFNYKHDFLNTEHQVEITSDFNLWKFRLGGFIQNASDKPLNLNTLQGGAKVGIRLF